MLLMDMAREDRCVARKGVGTAVGLMGLSRPKGKEEDYTKPTEDHDMLFPLHQISSYRVKNPSFKAGALL